MIMLRRTSASQWFNGPIIELTEHQLKEAVLPFPEEHKSALNRLEYIYKRQEAYN